MGLRPAQVHEKPRHRRGFPESSRRFFNPVPGFPARSLPKRIESAVPGGAAKFSHKSSQKSFSNRFNYLCGFRGPNILAALLKWNQGKGRGVTSRGLNVVLDAHQELPDEVLDSGGAWVVVRVAGIGSGATMQYRGSAKCLDSSRLFQGIAADRSFGQLPIVGVKAVLPEGAAINSVHKPEKLRWANGRPLWLSTKDVRP